MKCMFYHLELYRVYLLLIEYRFEFVYFCLKLAWKQFQSNVTLVSFVYRVVQILGTELLNFFACQYQMLLNSCHNINIICLKLGYNPYWSL